MVLRAAVENLNKCSPEAVGLASGLSSLLAAPRQCIRPCGLYLSVACFVHEIVYATRLEAFYRIGNLRHIPLQCDYDSFCASYLRRHMKEKLSKCSPEALKLASGLKSLLAATRQRIRPCRVLFL